MKEAEKCFVSVAFPHYFDSSCTYTPPTPPPPSPLALLLCSSSLPFLLLPPVAVLRADELLLVLSFPEPLLDMEPSSSLGNRLPYPWQHREARSRERRGESDRLASEKKKGWWEGGQLHLAVDAKLESCFVIRRNLQESESFCFFFCCSAV